MKEKLKITEENYKEIMLKRAIILCWVLLAICFVIKIFGGNLFEIVCTNEKFIKVCEFVDNSIIYYIIGFLTYSLTNIFLILTISNNKKLFSKPNILFLLLTSIYWCFKLFINLGYIYVSIHIVTIIDLLCLYLLLFIFTKKPVMSLIAIVLMYVFTLLSVIIKNTGINHNIDDSTLVSLIFMVDYYIMLVLTFLYSLKIKRRS
jgi:hypothetical protein